MDVGRAAHTQDGLKKPAAAEGEGEPVGAADGAATPIAPSAIKVRPEKMLAIYLFSARIHLCIGHIAHLEQLPLTHACSGSSTDIFLYVYYASRECTDQVLVVFRY